MDSMVLADGTVHRHTLPEMTMLRQELKLWWFDIYKDPPTMKEWAKKHHVSYQWARERLKEPDFISEMEEFRKSHREEGELALQNLFRFALDENPRVAIPALKIVADTMGFNAPQKLEVSTKGMSMADYLLYVQQNRVEVTTVSPEPKVLPENAESLEGVFVVQIDPWETIEEESAA